MTIFTSLINLFRPKPVKCCGGKCHTINGLPTLAEFEKLPLGERTKLFVRWVSEQLQEKEYDYSDNDKCPLAQFGQAVVGSTGCRVRADGSAFHYQGKRWDVLPAPEYVTRAPFAGFVSSEESALIRNSTFGDLAKAYRKLGLI